MLSRTNCITGWLLVGLLFTCAAPGTARAEPPKPGPAVQALAKTCQAKTGAPAAAVLERMNKTPERQGWTIVAQGDSSSAKGSAIQGVIRKGIDRFVVHTDLLKAVSRYIGETEKNLEKLFKDATRRDAVLFFDEADALFGKRTDYRLLKNSWAHKQRVRILKRIRAYPGLVVLGTRKPLTAEARKSASKTADIILPNKLPPKNLWKSICPQPAQ